MIKVKRLQESAKIPSKKNVNDAGYDLYSNESITLEPNKHKLISTGVALELPKNTVGLIWDRSSMAMKGIKSMGGVIDNEYRGEIKVILKNLNNEEFLINKGDRIAQIIIHEISHKSMVEVNQLENSKRGENGFGSTGK